MCKAQAPVAGGIAAFVGFVDQNDAGILFLQALAQGEGVIGGTVIQDEDLEIPVGLRTDAADAALNIQVRVVSRDNETDKRGRHDSYSFFSGVLCFFFSRTDGGRAPEQAAAAEQTAG